MNKLAFLPLALIAASPAPVPSPNEIVAAAKAEDWVAIAPADLLVMDLAADRDAKPRRVVIQLMPAPFSQGWVGNIRKLAAAQWWDGTSVNRVQDNYVVQWGDVTEKKPLLDGLAVVPESAYSISLVSPEMIALSTKDVGSGVSTIIELMAKLSKVKRSSKPDQYAPKSIFVRGWPVAADPNNTWPVHCYGMVGVGRNMPPDTGTGAELYTVIGHAPRHLDRNIALVGRVIAGVEHLSSLPRGTGDLGFYKTAEERVPILSVRTGDKVTVLPTYEYLSTESASFAAYADARANRRDAFFIRPAGGADICNIPVPVRVGK
jgi:cyclophilin family peptidyl-prolyl cis-trans isomerase